MPTSAKHLMQFSFYFFIFSRRECAYINGEDILTL